METSNLALAYSVAELKKLIEGAFLNSVQLVNEAVFKIKVHSKEHGTIDLVATPNALYKTSFKLQAEQQQSGFAAFLKKKLYNKRILLVEQHFADRIIQLSFAEYDLIFELFAKGNVILLDKQGKIISCYRNEEWRDRTTRRNEQYKFPQTKPSILSTAEKDFEKILKESEQDCVRAIVSALNIAPIAVEEACAIAGIKKEKKAALLQEKEAKKLFKTLLGFYSLEKAPDPIVVETTVGEKQLLPFKFESITAKPEKKFSSFSEAFDEIVSPGLLGKEEKEAQTETDKKKARLLHSQKEQLKARERFEKDTVESKKKAELIYSNYSEIKELMLAVKAALEKKVSKKDIMYKIKSAGEKGNKSAKLFEDVDPKTKKLVLEFSDK